MLSNLALDFGGREHSVVVLNRCVSIQSAERQKVPVIVPNPLAGYELFCAVRVALQAGPAVVSRPGRVYRFSFQRLELTHREAHGGTHAIDVRAEELEIVRPPKVFRAAADEVLLVDVMTGVVLGEEGLEGDA